MGVVTINMARKGIKGCSGNWGCVDVVVHGSMVIVSTDLDIW